MIKESRTGHYVHFHPETQTYQLKAGMVGACVFAEHLFAPFIQQMLHGNPAHFEKAYLPAGAAIKRTIETSAYADLRSKGYDG